MQQTAPIATPVAPLPSEKLVHAAATAIWDKKGFEVVALRVREIAQYTDHIVICSATSDRHAAAIADHIEHELRVQFGAKAIGVEGKAQGRWILLDFSDLVVHVFHRPVRDYYEIERLYADAPRIDLQEPAWVRETSPDELVEQAGDVGDLLWQEAALTEAQAAADSDEDDLGSASTPYDDADDDR